MFDALREYAFVLRWLTVASALTLGISALLTPLLVARMPEDYFLPTLDRRPPRHPLMRGLRLALGLVIVAAGVLMLVLPGQGVLTILLGLMLMQGKRVRQFERWIVRRARLLPALNWIRRRASKPPLLMPEPDEG